MGNDTCGLLADYPKAKKSRTDELEDEDASNWAYLPSVVLHDVFSMLNHKDRINASGACRNWRQNFYHPHFWQKATFKLSTKSDPCYAGLFIARIVQNIVVKFDSLSTTCVAEFINVLQHLSVNTNLKSLLIEPSHCQITLPYKYFDMFIEDKNALLTESILECCSLSLRSFSIGGCEDLCHHTSQILKNLANKNPNQVRLLGLASVKDDPLEYVICEADASLFTPFRNIEVLSIDYDIVSDEFIYALKDANKLSRLIIHVHGVWHGHPGTSEEAWIQFKQNHPDCELRLSFIHSYDEIGDMQNYILRRNMPLSHFKVFFCEQINTNVLKILPTWYSKTLRSIVWVDSQSHDSQARSMTLVKLSNSEPDPLIMAAWTCTKLEEVVLLGYQYCEESLVAIARLRSDTLKVLEIASRNVWTCCPGHINSQREISNIIGKPWAPLKENELHPVLYNASDGDSDEYILPKVLADLY